MTRQTRKPCIPASFRVPATASAGAMARTGLALGVSTFALMPMAMAQSAEAPATLAPVQVVGEAIDPNPDAEPGAPYKARTSGDERHVKPIAETPQTITVLTGQQMQDTGRSDLRDILRAQPGITLGTGENGNAFGDRYIIRGQEARSDVFVDGLRDPGMTVRESFAVEQLEITKGPSSTFAGRGATGGAINAITKQATTDVGFNKLSAGIGTDDYRRLTADSNVVINDMSAVRINLLHAYQEVPDRGPADRERNGVALSYNLRPTDTLDLTADYYHLDSDDRPDLGSWLDDQRKPTKHIPVYAQEQDFLESEIDTYTLRARYYIDGDTRVTNLTRYGTTTNGYVATGARATTTDPTDPNGVYDTVSLSTHQGWQEVEYFANQTNLYLDRELGEQFHQFIFSLEYTDHSVLNGQYDVTNATNCITAGRSGPRASTCIVDPSGNTIDGINSVLNRQISKGDPDIDWNVKTISLAAMDTVDLTDEWTLFAGLRYDRFDYRNVVTDRNGVTTEWKLDDGLWNGHLGLTWQFRPDANVYLTYSTASDFNGGESDVSSCDYGGICVPSTGPSGTLSTAERQALFAQSKPELSENIELGTKWNVNRGKLLLTAAFFQVTKSDVMEIVGGASYTDIGAINTGKYRVRGVEFGLAGNLTERLSAQAGLAIMNAKWLKSQDDTRVGAGLTNFPETSASVLLSYAVTPVFTVGGNVTYQGRKYSGTPESPEQLSVKVPDYTVLDLFAAYRFNRNLSARLNIGNVTDETYYLSAYRSGAFMYLGDARSARLTFNYDF
ncbi:TonB-dependent siderophore receptor [Nitrogeniibacter mangrovi]|uniref:TonB-dependent siderophore receptor n=1 Tax=Nitrogeniibacter mangrovi TaxID=2016596 RepID=A0A6C1B914_9RHOO|nr:TonB-dependent siderophore receptor [Nitrogeniibacter mangrovi]QID18830.1 TonB-dependent siderophore receptor [Nitrogeniibacter mangrovi]